MDVKGESGQATAPRKVTAVLTEEERAALIGVAAVVGSRSVGGPERGQPSLTALLQDIASGAVACRRVAATGRDPSTTERIVELSRRAPTLKAREIAAAVGCGLSTVYAVWREMRADRLEKGAPTG